MKIISREILLSFWKVHILHHASEGPVYGQWMLNELRRHGYDISPGTLYPLLQRMEKHGWLRCEYNPEEGPRARRNYYLTKEGRKVLKTVRGQVEEMYREVVQESRGKKG
jgi:PadR family transcriptional regulator PadR